MQCTAKSKRSGQQCRNYAVTGKDKCRMHGGTTPIKHGLYSKYATTTLGSRLEQAENDPELLSAKRQVALLAALQSRKFDQLAQLDDDEVADDQVEELRKLTDSMGKALERYQKLDARPENLVPLELLGKVVDLFADAINQYVTDGHARAAILASLDAGLRLATPARARSTSVH